MIQEGEKVLINKKEYTLGHKIGGGSEGSIFDVEGYPKFVIKVINDRNMTELQRNGIYKHLKRLYELGSREKDIKQALTLPKFLLDNHLGYIMVKADNHVKLEKYIKAPEDNADFDHWYKEEYPLKKRYQIIVNLFRELRKIHLAGIVFTDLSPNNIMVHKSENQIVFIDTDNIRIRTDSYLSVLGTPGYMAPEIYREHDRSFLFKNNIRPSLLTNCGRSTPQSDIFSAAVIAFQLLTLQHPFIGDIVDEGTPEMEEEALKGKTDYIFKKGTDNSSKSCLVPFFDKLTTPEIRDLFYKTFVDGKNNPDLRPTDEAFLEAFQNGLNLIVECPKCGFAKVYSFDDKNKCINCKEPIGEKVVMIIYNVFYQIRRDELINSIGNYPELNIDIDNLDDKSNIFEVSRIILEPGEKKFLYLYHFEFNANRSKMYARVILDENETTLRVDILSDEYKQAYLIEKNTQKIIPLGKGKENIQYNRYEIVFNNKKQGKGILQIVCKFIKM